MLALSVKELGSSFSVLSTWREKTLSESSDPAIYHMHVAVAL